MGFPGQAFNINGHNAPANEIELHAEILEDVIAPCISFNHNETLTPET